MRSNLLLQFSCCLCLIGLGAGCTSTVNAPAYRPASSADYVNRTTHKVAIGKIDDDQVQDYAARREESVDENERWLSPLL